MSIISCKGLTPFSFVLNPYECLKFCLSWAPNYGTFPCFRPKIDAKKAKHKLEQTPIQPGLSPQPLHDWANVYLNVQLGQGGTFKCSLMPTKRRMWEPCYKKQTVIFNLVPLQAQTIQAVFGGFISFPTSCTLSFTPQKLLSKSKHSLQDGAAPETCPPAPWSNQLGFPHLPNWILMFSFHFLFFISIFISILKGQSDFKSFCLLRDGDWKGALLGSAPSSGERLSCLQLHKPKTIHKSVCFVNMKVQHKAFRHQLNLNITVFIVMNNKSFSPALQQQGIIQQKFNF